MTDATDPVKLLAERAKEANEKAVVKATEGFDDDTVAFDVEIRRDGTARVENLAKGTRYTVSLDTFLPSDCDGPAKEYGHYGDDELCKHMVAVLSHLLNDALALYRLVRQAGGITLAVSAYAVGHTEMEIVGKMPNTAGDVTVFGDTLPEYWQGNHGIRVPPDSVAFTVRFVGQTTRYHYPADVLTPRVRA